MSAHASKDSEEAAVMTATREARSLAQCSSTRFMTPSRGLFTL